MVGLLVAVWLNVLGLDIAKWLSNVGGLAAWIPALLLIVLGLYSWSRYGSAVALTPAALVPSTGLKDIVFWSSIAFAFGGVEGASTMGEEIKDARHIVPRAALVAAVVITAMYMIATLALLVAIPKEQVSGLQGIMQAVQVLTGRLGLAWLVPVVAVLVTLNAVGAVGGWFAATARLPFVAGLDRFLPPAFGRLHPRWGRRTSRSSTQAAIAGVFVLLGQAGTSVHGAYDALVSMGIIAYFIPFLFMFAALIKLQGEPVGPGVARVPGDVPSLWFSASWAGSLRRCRLCSRPSRRPTSPTRRWPSSKWWVRRSFSSALVSWSTGWAVAARLRRFDRRFDGRLDS